MELTKQFAAPSGRRRKKLFEHRKLRQRFAQRYEFARRRQPQRGAAGKPFEIEDALELLANFTANNGLLDEVCDGIKTALNGLTLDERPEKPGAQQARAHPSNGSVERRNQRSGATRSASFLGEYGREQFQIADGYGIEHQSVVLLVIADAV